MQPHLSFGNEANVQKQKQPPASIATAVATSHKQQVALQYSAILPTRLALMRWTRGGDVPHIVALHHPLPQRAAWYDQLQHGLQSWLEAGGFHQPEPTDVSHDTGTTTASETESVNCLSPK